KLTGDVRLERALQARDSGHLDEAEREFSLAVQSYKEAALIGQSDSEVYVGLAETWVRTIEMASSRGHPAEAAYAAALEASDKILVVVPESIEGPLKRAFAAYLSMGPVGAGGSTDEAVQQCLAAVEAALRKQPGNPYASEIGSACYDAAADAASTRGEDPEVLLRKGLQLLEPVVKKNPRFLWGTCDLGANTLLLGWHLQKRGDPSAQSVIKQALTYFELASSLDPGFASARANAINALGALISLSGSDQEIESILARADEQFKRCMAINSEWTNCNVNYFY